jgi:estrone sulfotransferase
MKNKKTSFKSRLSRAYRLHVRPHNLKDFSALPTDIFLVSYPRSGNTWMRYMLANLLEPEQEWNIQTINRIVPDIHKKWPEDYIERTPRIIKSHFPYQEIYRNVIYLFRDGRDVAVSYYDYLKKVHNYPKSFEDYFEEFLKGSLRYGAWHTHAMSIIFSSRPMKVLSIKYEDLVTDTIEQVQRIAAFLSVTWSKELINISNQKSSLQRQQKDIMTLQYETLGSKGFQGGVKGSPGKWKEVLSYAQNDKFWDVCGPIAEKLGYSKVV